MPVQLVDDIWTHVIDLLAPDCIAGPSEHYADLSAAALTCQAWLSRARRQLYKHVELRSLQSVWLFARTISECFSLGTLVRRLEFWFTEKDWEVNSSGCNLDVPFPKELIGCLTALYGLRFSSSTDTILSPNQLKFVTQWMGHERIRVLWMDGLQFDTAEYLIHLIRSFSQLVELNLFQVWWSGAGAAVSTIGYSNGCQKLTHVELDQVFQVDDILPGFGTSIRYLSVGRPLDGPFEDTYQAITRLHDLRTLKVLVHDLSYPWLTSVFSQVLSPHLEELVLNLSGLGREADSDALTVLANCGLDEVLARPPFDKLRRLKIVFVGNNKTGKAARQLQQAECLLPQFHKRAVIEVEIERWLKGGEEIED